MIQLLQLAYTTGIGLLGIGIGYCLQLVIRRLPTRLQQYWTDQAITYLTENQTPIPLISSTPVPAMQLPAYCIPLLTGVLFTLAAYTLLSPLLIGFSLIFISVLICIAFIDLQHEIIPDELTLPTLWCGLLINIPHMICPLSDAVIGAVVGYTFLWVVYHVFKWLTHKEGMGYGDFKLLSLIGAWLGWETLPMVILIASVSGMMVGFVRIALKMQARSQPMPFGPFLALGGYIVLLWPQTISQLYYFLLS